MAFVKSNGVTLHVQRLAEPGATPPRPVVVFLHGLVDSLASYYFTLASPVADLGFDVITYDLRGHGRSERPGEGYLIRDAVDDLMGMLDGLGVDGPVHLVGYSFGGTVAFSATHRHPDRVLSLSVIESEPPTAAWARRTADGVAEVRASIADQEYVDAQDDLVRKMAAAAFRLDDTTTAYRDLLSPDGLLDHEDVGSVRVPLLLIIGGESALNSHAEEFLPALPHCRVRVIPGRDHMLLARAPDEVGRILLPWLAEQRDRR
ncbi:alpha/beta hydrolase [Umezawaea sp. Da 62-37]|uniref:alpha/beta fold hydrolase n=1 Tax=Umezawaea sp. Da 62-37 TaxID=3075927 RepID=UPI0028F6C51A|nr:alpha/beta hydrolase [Umezawaea sp. Da 62-37]WNV86237.1 alpha/beta hydrolase [Umezawaea sp. Da 62-37]